MDQEQMSSNSPVHIIDESNNEEIPLTDNPPDQIEEIPSAAPISLEWDTSRLIQICQDGDLARLRHFIEYSKQTLGCRKHANEIADRLEAYTGLSPLHHAARCQQLDICLVLLSNIDFKLGVDIKDEHDRTPIYSVFRSSNNIKTNNLHPKEPINLESDLGDKIYKQSIWQDEYQNKIFLNDHPLVYLFAKSHGDINARDKYLFTPLHYAVTRNNLAGVKQLIKLNADIESRDRQGIRPLHIACREGYLSIAEYLIEQGAKINVIDTDQWTVLHYACAKGHADIIKLLKSKTQVTFPRFIHMKTNTNSSCLHLAVQHGNIHSVQYILTECHDENLKTTLINEQVEPLGTSLHIAAKFCDPSMISFLYQNGADPLILNSQNQSPLHIACVSNRLPIVKELFSLTQSSLLEIKDNHGETALSVTTNFDIINELITFGSDISSLNKNHMNVLMIAVSKGELSIVEYLLFSIDDQSVEIFNQVTKRYNRSIFLIAVEKGSIEMCSLLLTHPNIHWDTIDKQRMNAFHIAAQNNHYKLIEFLCKHIRKTDQFLAMKSRTFSMTTDLEIFQSSPALHLYIDAQTEDGKTPLHLAAEHGYTFCIESLLKYGADVFLPDYVRQLAFHIAIQNGFSECVDLITQASIRNMTDFQFVLSSRQSPLITACQNGFIDIVRILLDQNIGIDYDNREENPLEIAIKFRQIEIIHLLLEQPHTKHWLMSIRKRKTCIHQTPLRDMIQFIPECAKHAFDKLIIKTDETDLIGNTIEKIEYNYKFIDDYFMDNGKLYSSTSHQLYRNHPFIIALDSENDFLLRHPLARQLLTRKWELYRPFIYLSILLIFLLLFMLTFYVLTIPAPKSKSIPSLPFIRKFILPMQWTIVSLAGMNLFKIILEIILYRGLRVPFAQLFGFISFLTAIIAFIPYNYDNPMTHWQWELAAFSTLFQWFNSAFILRSVPFVGKCIVMFQSILINFVSLIFVALPLLIAFTIATQMIFHNHSPFFTMTTAIRKLSAMLIGEFGYEDLFFSKPTFLAAAFIFIPFIVIMTIVFMNLLLGLSVGDIQKCMENARAKARAYRIRELIYTESTLPSLTWLKRNTPGKEITYNDLKDSILKTNNEQNEKEDDDEDYNESLANRRRISELSKLLDILNMLCTQAKQSLQKEIHLENILKQLLAVRKTHISIDSTSDE